MNLSELNSAEFRQFVQDHLSEDPALLLFKYQGKVTFDLKMAVQQISARQKVSKKLPSWSANRFTFSCKYLIRAKFFRRNSSLQSKRLERQNNDRPYRRLWGGFFSLEPGV